MNLNLSGMLKIRAPPKRSAFTVGQDPQPPTIKFSSDKSKLLSDTRQELYGENSLQSSSAPSQKTDTQSSMTWSNPSSAAIQPGISNKLIVKFNYRRPGQLNSLLGKVDTSVAGTSTQSKLQKTISTESPIQPKGRYFHVKSATMAKFLTKSDTEEPHGSQKKKMDEIPKVIIEKGGKTTPVKVNIKKEPQEDVPESPEVIMKNKNLMLVKLPFKTLKSTRPSVQTVVIKQEKEDPEFQGLEKPGVSNIKLAAVDAPTLPSLEDTEPDHMEHKPLARIEPQSGGQIHVKVEPGLDNVRKIGDQFDDKSMISSDIKVELQPTGDVKEEYMDKVETNEVFDVEPSMVGLARTHAPILNVGSPKDSRNTVPLKAKTGSTITDYFPRVKKFISTSSDTEQSASTSSVQSSATGTKHDNTTRNTAENPITASALLASNITKRKEWTSKPTTASGNKRSAPGPSNEVHVKRPVKTGDVLRRGSRPSTSRYRINNINILRKNKQNTTMSK